MRFCDNCGSYMKRTANGFLCAKCGRLVRADSEKRMEKSKQRVTEGIYVIDHRADHRAKRSHVCPKCGNREAFHWVSNISGEHAGVRRERTVEHFQCAKCFYSWSKTS